MNARLNPLDPGCTIHPVLPKSHRSHMCCKQVTIALASVAQLVGASSVTKGLQVRFLVRAHAWVADPIPGTNTCNLWLGHVQEATN